MNRATFLSSLSQTMRGERQRREGEAGLQHIPAEAASSDVTFREKKEKQRRKEIERRGRRAGLDKQT